jgi:hypothetical protein
MLHTRLDFEYTVRDSLYRVQRNRKFFRIIRKSQDESSADLFISQLNENFRPGFYYFSFQIKNPESNKAVEKIYKVSFPQPAEQRLTVSDIERAHRIMAAGEGDTESPFRKGSLLVTPYPSSAVSSLTPATFYFEVYNLLIGPGGRTDYRVEYELRTRKGKLLEKLNPFEKETTALSTEFRQTGERRDEQVYFSLDFSRVKPGDYTLEITVTDQVSGESKQAEMALKLVE